MAAEFRYSVTDVVFEDVGDIAVPADRQSICR